MEAIGVHYAPGSARDWQAEVEICGELDALDMEMTGRGSLRKSIRI